MLSPTAELSKLLAEKEGEIESARRELTEKEGEVESVRQELGVARQASSDLHAQLHDAHSKMEQLVSRWTCTCHMTSEGECAACQCCVGMEHVTVT